MPKVQAGGITMNYDQQGSGEPLVLIPYLAADHACYAFQIADYSKHFTCISVDLRGTGESDKPGGVYSTEMFADDNRRAHAGDRRIKGARRRALFRGGHRHLVGREVPGPCQVTLPAQWLAQE
jgi:pimeloyl-ACP methyl ester carboxylesterase